MPFRITAPYKADGSLGISQGVSLHIVGRFGLSRQAVLENEAGDADAIQVFGDVSTLPVEVEESVAAARSDNHRRARRFTPWRREYGYRGVMNTRDFEVSVFFTGRLIDFLSRLAFRAG